MHAHVLYKEIFIENQMEQSEEGCNLIRKYIPGFGRNVEIR